MPLRFFLLNLILWGICACQPAAPPLPLVHHTPEIALQALHPRDGPLHILAKYPSGQGTILLFSSPNQGGGAFNNPRPQTGSVYLEHDATQWVALMSSFGTPVDPTMAPDKTVVHGINTVTNRHGNSILFLQGQALDERILWVEARLVSGDMIRTQTTEGLFALATPSFNGFCALRFLDGNEDLIEAQELLEDVRCVPDLFWRTP